MKAILLCAGRGSRLDPLTRDQPKCLVQVGRRAILDHQVEALHKAGIIDVIVVGGYRYPQLEAHIDAMAQNLQPRLIENPYWETTGSIGSVWAARALLDSPFALFNGDTIFEAELIADVLFNIKPGINLVIEHSEAELDDMRVATSHERVILVGKLMSPSIGQSRSLGMIFSTDPDGRTYRSALETVFGEPYGEQCYHHDIIGYIAQKTKVHAITIEGFGWQEIDRAEDIAAWERRSLRNAA